jgi:hypothetical protein
MKYTVILALVFSAFIFGCKKKENSPEPDNSASTTNTTPAVDVNSARQATFTMDGVNKSYIQDGGTIISACGLSGSGSGSNSYNSDIVNHNNTISYFSIKKGTLNYSTSATHPSDSVFKAFFSIATSIPYSVNAANGVEISIYDNGIYWTTSLGTADQTGSTFNIEQTKNGTDFSGALVIVMKATYSCKVYDGNGNSKTITNGVFVGYFANY